MQTSRWLAVAFIPALALGAVQPAPAKRVTLVVDASTWREHRKPYDIRAAFTRKLNEAGVTVVKSGPADADISVQYGETEGSEFREVGREDGPTRTATNIDFSLEMTVGTSELLSLKLDADPGTFTQGDLYGAVLRTFQEKDTFAFAGHLVASALGVKASLPRLLPMLCGEEGATARTVLDAAGFQPRSPAEEAYFARADGKIDRLVELGKPAVPTVLECVRRTEPTYPFIDEDAVNVIARIGDPRGTPWLLEKLGADQFISMMNSPEMGFEDKDVPDDILLIVRALGSAGDDRALSRLDSLALKKKKFPTLATAAKDAASQIRARHSR